MQGYVTGEINEFWEKTKYARRSPK